MNKVKQPKGDRFEKMPVVKMQKALRLINIRLDSALRDVMGRSGKDIIEAILKGERDAKVLASLAQPTVKKRKKK